MQIKLRIVRIDTPLYNEYSTYYWLSTGCPLAINVLLLGLLAYSVFTFHQIHKNKGDISDLYEHEEEVELAIGTLFYVKNLGFLLAGLALIALGANWMVSSAVTIAQLLGMSELVVGLTIVSIGTSLPEVATSITAARKGNADIAVTNVLGSNIYNTC